MAISDTQAKIQDLARRLEQLEQEINALEKRVIPSYATKKHLNSVLLIKEKVITELRNKVTQLEAEVAILQRDSIDVSLFALVNHTHSAADIIGVPKSVWNAANNPTSTDDSTKNFEPGSHWINVASGAVFICIDATPGAAIWQVASDGTTGFDAAAFHDNLAKEILNLPEKVPVDQNDLVLIEDSQGGTYLKKKATVQSIRSLQTIQSLSGEYTVPLTVNTGTVVYLSGVKSVDIASHLSLSTSPAIGLVLDKPTATTATILFRGITNLFTGLSPTQRYFLGPNGDITTTPPNAESQVIQEIGYAIDSTTLMFDTKNIVVL
jgi:hypothetical protein